MRTELRKASLQNYTYIVRWLLQTVFRNMLVECFMIFSDAKVVSALSLFSKPCRPGEGMISSSGTKNIPAPWILLDLSRLLGFGISFSDEMK